MVSFEFFLKISFLWDIVAFSNLFWSIRAGIFYQAHEYMEKKRVRRSHVTKDPGQIQARGLNSSFLIVSLIVNKSNPLRQLWALIVQTDINFTFYSMWGFKSLYRSRIPFEHFWCSKIFKYEVIICQEKGQYYWNQFLWSWVVVSKIHSGRCLVDLISLKKKNQ